MSNANVTKKNSGKIGRPGNPIKIGAVTYPSLVRYCKVMKLPYNVMYNRLAHGMTISEARKKPVNKYDNIFVDGVSLNSYCAANGLPYTTILHRVRHGMSVEDAVSRPIRHYTRPASGQASSVFTISEITDAVVEFQHSVSEEVMA